MLNESSVRWMQQGLQFHQSGNFEQAQICYQKSLSLQADNYESLQLLGALMLKLKQPARAIEYLKKSLLIAPKQAHVLNSLGNAYKADAQLNKAKMQYQQSLQLKPDYIDPYLNLASLLFDINQDAEIEILLKSGAVHFTNNWRFLVLQAKFAKHQKNYELAIEQLLKANSLSPNQISVLHDLGLVYRLNGQSSIAVDYYQQVAKFVQVVVLLSYAASANSL